MSDLGICPLCFIRNCFDVVGLCSCGFDLEGVSYLGICALCYIANCFGVVRLCSSGFDLLGYI